MAGAGSSPRGRTILNFIKSPKEPDGDIGRKFANSWAFFETDMGVTEFGYIKAISGDMQGFRIYRYFPKLKAHVEYKNACPLYTHIPPQWTQVKNLDGELMDVFLGRYLMEKQFSCGLSKANCYVKTFMGHEHYLGLLHIDEWPLINRPGWTFDKNLALNTTGILSNQFYLSKKHVYHLDTIIGMRNGRSLVVESSFKQELQDELTGYDVTFL